MTEINTDLTHGVYLGQTDTRKEFDFKKLFQEAKKSIARIRTKSVTKHKIHLGWKVYIDGEKFPKKPQDYYGVISEEVAVRIAWDDYQRRSFGVIHRQENRPFKRTPVTDADSRTQSRHQYLDERVLSYFDTGEENESHL